MVCPPGISRSKPQTPRAERRATGGVAFHFAQLALELRGSEARGSNGPGVPRALQGAEGGGKTRAYPRRPNNRGDGARLFQTLRLNVMPDHHDALETRDPAQRQSEQFGQLPQVIARAMSAPGWARHLAGVE